MSLHSDVSANVLEQLCNLPHSLVGSLSENVRFDAAGLKQCRKKKPFANMSLSGRTIMRRGREREREFGASVGQNDAHCTSNNSTVLLLF